MENSPKTRQQYVCTAFSSLESTTQTHMLIDESENANREKRSNTPIEAAAMIGVAILKIHLPLPRAFQAWTTEAIRRKSARENTVTRNIGWCCKNTMRSLLSDSESPRRVQIQKIMQPKVKKVRALTEQWLPRVSIPSSLYSGSTYIQLTQTAMPLTTDSGVRHRYANMKK